MIEVVEFEARHCTDLILQDAQSFAQPMLLVPEYAQALIDGGPHYSAMLDGRVIGCAGVWMIEAHRGIAWALLAEDIGYSLYFMHKAVKRFLDDFDLQRIETAVDYNFTAGHRWAKLLGFKPEGVMKRYFPNGHDAILYARIQ